MLNASGPSLNRNKNLREVVKPRGSYTPLDQVGIKLGSSHETKEKQCRGF